MKILIINGSPRKNGATGKILKYYNEYFIKNYSNINVELVNLLITI